MLNIIVVNIIGCTVLKVSYCICRYIVIMQKIASFNIFYSVQIKYLEFTILIRIFFTIKLL